MPTRGAGSLCAEWALQHLGKGQVDPAQGPSTCQRWPCLAGFKLANPTLLLGLKHRVTQPATGTSKPSDVRYHYRDGHAGGDPSARRWKSRRPVPPLSASPPPC
ncbi:hypothetical protein ABBQ38_014384 [Trebouxia sp. C0009 RCD-2024]